MTSKLPTQPHVDRTLPTAAYVNRGATGRAYCGPKRSVASLIEAIEHGGRCPHTFDEMGEAMRLLHSWGVVAPAYVAALALWVASDKADRIALWVMSSDHPVAHEAARCLVAAAEVKAIAEQAS